MNNSEPQSKQIHLRSMVQTVMVPKGYLALNEPVCIMLPGHALGIRGTVEQMQPGPTEYPDHEYVLVRTVNK